MSSANSNDPPATPESQRRTARISDRLQQLQMTDPDQRRTRISGRNDAATESIPQPNFFAQLAAAQIPQVHVPDSIYAPKRFPVPGIGVSSALQQPAGPSTASHDPFTISNPIPQPTIHIPQVQLPAGWDAPLQNRIPIVPPAPQLQIRREKERERGRERNQETVDPANQQQLLQQMAQQRRVAEEERAEAAQAELRREHSIRQEQARARQQALDDQPHYQDPPRIDIQAALEARRRQDQELIQHVHNMWRQQRRADELQQQDELEAENRRIREDRDLLERMLRLEEIENNLMADRLRDYEAQIAAQAEQLIQQDMMNGTALHYDQNRNPPDDDPPSNNPSRSPSPHI